MPLLLAYRIPLAKTVLSAAAVVGLAASVAPMRAEADSPRPTALRDQHTAPDRSARRPLGAAALRALLADAHVTPRLPAGVYMSEAPREFFGADGIYFRSESRRRNEGRFVIRGDRLCVHGEGIRRLCRRVFPRGNGTYLFVNLSDGSSTLMSVALRR